MIDDPPAATEEPNEPEPSKLDKASLALESTTAAKESAEAEVSLTTADATAAKQLFHEAAALAHIDALATATDPVQNPTAEAQAQTLDDPKDNPSQTTIDILDLPRQAADSKAHTAAQQLAVAEALLKKAAKAYNRALKADSGQRTADRPTQARTASDSTGGAGKGHVAHLNHGGACTCTYLRVHQDPGQSSRTFLAV